MTSEIKTFSFKAEFQGDIHPFMIAAGKVAMEQQKLLVMTKFEGGGEHAPGQFNECGFVEIKSTLDLETLKKIAFDCEDCHRIEQTLRQCPMELNSFKWY